MKKIVKCSSKDGSVSWEEAPKDPSLRQRLVSALDGDGIYILVFGQSNCANFVSGITPNENASVFEIHQGDVYVYQEPMLGADANSGSHWGIFSRLLQEHTGRKVFLVNVAVGGTSISKWSPQGGEHHSKLLEAIDMSSSMGFSFNCVLFHQGEDDVLLGTSADSYCDSFLSIRDSLRQSGLECPIYVAQTSYTKGRSSDEILSAQRSLSQENGDIRPGPNSDLIVGEGDRNDGVHFTPQGAEKHALAWFESLRGDFS